MGSGRSFSSLEDFAKANGIEKNKENKNNNRNNKIQNIETNKNNNSVNFYGPSDTAMQKNISNFNLRINKYHYFHEDSFKLLLKDDRKNINIRANLNNIINERLYKNIIEKIKLVASTHNNDSILLSQDWNMVIGISGSVYETSMTLHHIYGVPYIPGQAVKGMVRNYIISEIFDCVDFEEHLKYVEYVEDIYDKKIKIKNFKTEKLEKEIENKEDLVKKEKEEKKKKEKEKELLILKKIQEQIKNKDEIKEYLENSIKIFGSQERAGEVIFFDSYSEEVPKIDFDVFTPHYPDYYTKDNAPTDDQNPQPHVFLVVKGATFNFYIGSKKQDINNYKINSKTISEWLEEALINHGIGAKTAVGYGYFQKGKSK
ncbi:MAG: type III-B CRISPR module RAMP protein Cmr6 [Caldisericia bacterium]|nr:type III-B CRISPR module RAMP protein Cmr6 [Caldisericia bacterium]